MPQLTKGGGALARRRVTRSHGSARGLAASLLGAALVVLAPPATASGPTDPLDEAEADVAAIREEIDAAAGSYFELLDRAEALEANIAATEENLRTLQARADDLRRVVKERAASAYLRSGSTSLEFGLDGDEDALEVARRATLLNRLNRSDNEAAEELAELTATLDRRRAELDADRAAYEETLELLRTEQAELDAKLADAQARRADIVARREAEAREAAAAAAAETAADTAPPPPEEAPAPAPAPTQSAAPVAPPGYEPTPGEHPRHLDPFLVCTRTVESSGNYQAYNPAGPYYGAYQFLQRTWNVTANHAGRDELIGVVPSTASEYDQDDMAWELYQWQGKKPWNDRC